MEQYPAVLYQVLQDIESKGYVTREIYCDTAAVNLSQAVEEVAEMFKVKIVPISGGTPQELAYAESAVRTLGQMSRSLMLGAPHLPSFVWGMSDLYAAWIHNFLPQKLKGGKSPYEITTGRLPDEDVLFIRVFGCPCQYVSAYVVEHKRSAKTEWELFVGAQWPKVLILRPADHKVLSVSRKKVYCHELMYAKFDAETQARLSINFRDFTLDEAEVDDAIKLAMSTEAQSKESDEIPKHVLSVKVLSDSKRNQGLLSPQQQVIPEKMKADFHEHGSGECDEFKVPDELKFNGDRLLEDIQRMKSRLGHGSLSESILNAIKNVEDKIGNVVLTRGSLKRGKKPKSKVSLDPDNIISSKRQRIRAVKTPQEKLDPKPTKKVMVKAQVTLPALKADDRVKIRTECFGKDYAVGRQKYTYGRVVSVNGKIVDVHWYNAKGGGGVRMDARLSQLKRANPIMAILKHLSKNDSAGGWPIKTVETMLPVLEVGSALSESDPNVNGNSPKDFVEAMVRPDWRSWVEAVKSENDSWETFEACTEIPYDEIQTGASVIPLGELFTIKRSGKYKF